MAGINKVILVAIWERTLRSGIWKQREQARFTWHY